MIWAKNQRASRALTVNERVLSSPLAARNHWRCVRLAREFIEAHLGGALRMEMLCRHTGVSKRTLETAFREVTGNSPLQFIKARRLNVARHKLLTAHPQEISVKEAALTSGFWHLGHFSRDYFAQFGELPSMTLTQR
jgi:AraC family ethanolamine operon transcriptional activator